MNFVIPPPPPCLRTHIHLSTRIFNVFNVQMLVIFLNMMHLQYMVTAMVQCLDPCVLLVWIQIADVSWHTSILDNHTKCLETENNLLFIVPNISPPSPYRHVTFSAYSAIWNGLIGSANVPVPFPILIFSVRDQAFMFYLLLFSFLLVCIFFFLYSCCLYRHVIYLLIWYGQLSVHPDQRWQHHRRYSRLHLTQYLILRFPLTAGQLISFAWTFLSIVMAPNCLYLVQL